MFSSYGIGLEDGWILTKNSAADQQNRNDKLAAGEIHHEFKENK
jgi:hypothetical protein